MDSIERNLAQINIGRLKYPMGHPDMKGFEDMLIPVNNEAEKAPGFVWRLQSESGYSSDLSVFPDPMLIINLTVWESLEALRNFTYSNPLHRQVFRNRRDWLLPLQPSYALWYINKKDGYPTIEEGKERLNYLKTNGPSKFAFNFQQTY